VSHSLTADRYSLIAIRWLHMASAPKAVAIDILRKLRAAGHQALLAGGCVRDMLLGIRPGDYDVATSATPRQVRRLFGHVLLVGAKFGVAMVIVDRQKVEVTTFRAEDSYSDGRRPDSIRLASPREDALRRDFTINGMFYDPLERKVIDYVAGQEDLRRRIIRTIGPPDERFSEDYLRMMRAVRFAVRLGFRMEPATAAAVAEHSPKIAMISGERVFDELTRMLVRPSAGAAVAKLDELRLARHIVPELFAGDEGRWQRAAALVAALAPRRDATLNFAALLCELPPADIEKITRRWGASNEFRRTLLLLATNADGWQRAAGATAMSLAELKRLMAWPQWRRLLALWRARERLATGRTAASRRIALRAGAIDPARVAPAPLVTGDELKQHLGMKQGAAMGDILRRLYEAQLNEQIATLDDALAMARSLAAAQGL
jgi:tRNA nucleotidyltransferase/poly(A) polymerase